MHLVSYLENDINTDINYVSPIKIKSMYKTETGFLITSNKLLKVLCQFSDGKKTNKYQL